MGANFSASGLILPAISQEEKNKFITFALEHIDNAVFLKSITNVSDPTFDFPAISALNEREEEEEEDAAECSMILFRNFNEVSHGDTFIIFTLIFIYHDISMFFYHCLD